MDSSAAGPLPPPAPGQRPAAAPAQSARSVAVRETLPAPIKNQCVPPAENKSSHSPHSPNTAPPLPQPLPRLPPGSFGPATGRPSWGSSAVGCGTESCRAMRRPSWLRAVLTRTGLASPSDFSFCLPLLVEPENTIKLQRVVYYECCYLLLYVVSSMGQALLSHL